MGNRAQVVLITRPFHVVTSRLGAQRTESGNGEEAGAIGISVRDDIDELTTRLQQLPIPSVRSSIPVVHLIFGIRA
jgi:hypothetical protein